MEIRPKSRCLAMVLQIEEQWRPIEEYEDKYWVSNLGRVKNRSQVMKPKVTKSGKTTISLYAEGKNHYYSVPRLVAKAFLMNPHGYTKVMHRDGDPTNNRIDNLYWEKQFYQSETHGIFKLDADFYQILHNLENKYGSVIKVPNNDSDLMKLKRRVGNIKL